MCKAAKYVDSALQQLDQDTLIEQSVKQHNAIIKQHFAKHNHDIESMILSIIGLIFWHYSKA